MVDADASNTVIKNNYVSFKDVTGPGMLITDNSGNAVTSNNILTAAPYFVDSDNSNTLLRDFSLTASATEAIDRGDTVPVMDDFNGTSRNGVVYDIGTFEGEGGAITVKDQGDATACVTNSNQCVTQDACENAGWYFCNGICQAGLCDGTTCVTPLTGDVFNEGFIAKGYENNWLESIGTATLDENHSLGATPPAGSCTEGLYINFEANNTASATTHDLGAEIVSTNNIDINIDIRLISSNFPFDYRAYTVFQLSDYSAPTSNSNVVRLELGRESGTIKMRTKGASNSNFAALTTGTWHTIRIHLDQTATNSYLQIDGGTQNKFTRGPNAGRYIHLGINGSPSLTDSAVEYEVGRIWIDTP
jgi:hypothetical protein